MNVQFSKDDQLQLRNQPSKDNMQTNAPISP